MIPKIWRKAIGSDDKLPFTDHLDELRHRLIVSVVTVGIGFAVSYAFSQQILILLQRPMPTRLVFIAPTEAFFVNLKVAFYAGLFLSIPLILFLPFLLLLLPLLPLIPFCPFSISFRHSKPPSMLTLRAL